MKQGKRGRLVVTRKTNETIFIGDDIEVTITEVAGNSVRVCIQAPTYVPILRAELKKQGVEA